MLLCKGLCYLVGIAGFGPKLKDAGSRARWMVPLTGAKEVRNDDVIS